MCSERHPRCVHGTTPTLRTRAGQRDAAGTVHGAGPAHLRRVCGQLPARARRHRAVGSLGGRLYVGCSACPSHSDCAAAGKLTLTRLALGSTLPSALRVGVQPRFLPQSVMPQVGGWSSASETHHGTGDTPVRRDVTAGPPHCTSDRGALDASPSSFSRTPCEKQT